MRGRVFTIAAVVLTILSVLTFATWIASYWWGIGTLRHRLEPSGGAEFKVLQSATITIGSGYFTVQFSHTEFLQPRQRESSFVPPGQPATAQPVRFTYPDYDWKLIGPADPWTREFRFVMDRPGWKSLGLNFAWRQTPSPTAIVTVRHVTIPLPFIFLILSIIPVISGRRAWIARRRRIRNMKNLCISCGYDLRGSPGACPECGMQREVDRTTA